MSASGTETLWNDPQLKNPSGSTVEQIPMPRLVDWPNLGQRAPSVLQCPTCGFHVTVYVDTFAGDQHYVEDCPMCCCAIELDISVCEYRVSAIRGERAF